MLIHSIHFFHFHPLSSTFTHFHPLSSTLIQLHPHISAIASILSTFIQFHPFSSISATLSTFVHFHSFSSTCIHVHPLPSTFIHFHPCSSIFIYFPTLSFTFIQGVCLGLFQITIEWFLTPKPILRGMDGRVLIIMTLNYTFIFKPLATVWVSEVFKNKKIITYLNFLMILRSFCSVSFFSIPKFAACLTRSCHTWSSICTLIWIN